MRYGSLFSGYGGLDLGVQSVLGGETAWFVEFDKAPSRILAHHWPDVPNYGDITAVDFTTVEPVDVLTGGFPCQDVSHAGRRAGLIRDGEGRTRSGLWGHMLRAITELRPALVVAENVRGLLSARADSDVEPCPWCMGDGDGEPAVRALGAVLADLADVGYDAAWYGLRAADVGAAHGRFRVFIFATPADAKPLPLGQHGVARRLAAQAAGRIQEDRDTARPGALGGRPVDRGGGTANAGPLYAGSGLSEGVAHLDPHGFVGGVLPGVDLDEGGEVADGFGAEVEFHDSTLVPDFPAGQTSWGKSDQDHLLPTPTTRDYKDHRVEVAKHRPDDESTLNRAIAHHLLSTPRASDGPDATSHGRTWSGTDNNLHNVARNDAWGDYAPAIARWEAVLGRPAPAPTEPGKNGSPRLSPAFVEWLMGLPAGHVTNTAITRNEQLKALGNGVVPQQAAAATRAFLHDIAQIGDAA